MNGNFFPKIPRQRWMSSTAGTDGNLTECSTKFERGLLRGSNLQPKFFYMVQSNVPKRLIHFARFGAKRRVLALLLWSVGKEIRGP